MVLENNLLVSNVDQVRECYVNEWSDPKTYWELITSDQIPIPMDAQSAKFKYTYIYKLQNSEFCRKCKSQELKQGNGTHSNNPLMML